MKKALIAFSALLVTTAAADVARRLGWIGGFAEKRAIGLVIGAMAVVIGNYLPKMRPLRSAAAERSAGLILVATGIAYIALFVLAPLDLARRAAAILGIAALLMIAIQWFPVVRTLRFHGSQLSVILLLTFFYLFLTAIVVYLFGKQPWTEWIHGAFWMAYAFMLAMGDRRCLRD
jgi:hypothetical protein